ncbi:peptidoglycan DD-metalloendopeptidase family protein [Kiloniella litopenaei]|uniref:peptidoglycan DD-metalloendopeptidase family protein n=1 Tax=Kiloniella litopenaei TaxID=1549748 RepID=UPI003BAB2521
MCLLFMECQRTADWLWRCVVQETLVTNLMFNRTSLSTLKLGFILLSAGLYGCTINPSSFPTTTTTKKTTTATVYNYPPSILPKRKPTPPPKPSDTGQATGRVAGISIPALLPENIPLPKRNPRRQVRQSSSSPVVQQARTTPQTLNDQSQVSTTQYTVNRGDTVYSISRKRRVSIRELIILNRLSPPYKLLVGQIIKLPVSKEHVVIAGDTLYSISRRYGVETTALVKLNKINPPYALYIGQRLNLPALREGNTIRSATVSPVTNSPNVTTKNNKKSSPKTPVRNAIPDSPKNFTGPVPKPLPRSFSNFLRPVKGKVISSFGPKEGGIHNDGINISARRGTPVKAAENGVVVYAGSELKGFGQMLLIKHSDGWVTAYAHTDQLLVGRGQRVKRGQDIAKVGSTGNVSKPQLHFEIRKGSQAVNPNKLLTN